MYMYIGLTSLFTVTGKSSTSDHHPRFIVGLAAYLFPLGDPGASQIDNLALSEVCQKLGVTSHEVVGALKGGEWYNTL